MRNRKPYFKRRNVRIHLLKTVQKVYSSEPLDPLSDLSGMFITNKDIVGDPLTYEMIIRAAEKAKTRGRTFPEKIVSPKEWAEMQKKGRK